MLVGAAVALPASAEPSLSGVQGSATASSMHWLVGSSAVVGQDGPLDTALTAATLTGPAAFAGAYPGWPGPTLGNPGTLLEIFAPQVANGIQQGTGQRVPNLPKSEARADEATGEVRDRNATVPGSTAETLAAPTKAQALAIVDGAGGGAGTFRKATSTSQDELSSGKLAVAASAAVSDVVLGPVSVRSVSTSLSATTDGARGGSDGGTEVEGLTVAGVPLSVDERGVHLREQTVPAAASGAGDAAAAELLRENGVRILPLSVTSTADGSKASRTSRGLVIELATPQVESEPRPLPGGQQLPGASSAVVRVVVALASAHVEVAAAPGGEVADTTDSIGAPTVPETASGPGVVGVGSTGGAGVGTSGSSRAAPPAVSFEDLAAALRSEPLAPGAVLIGFGSAAVLGARLRRFYRSIVERALHGTA